MSKIISKIGSVFNEGFKKVAAPRPWYNAGNPTNLIYNAWSSIVRYSHMNQIFDVIIPRPSFVEWAFPVKNCDKTPSIVLSWCLAILIVITACFIAYRTYNKKQNEIVNEVLRREVSDANICPEPEDKISCGTQSNLNENSLQ